MKRSLIIVACLTTVAVTAGILLWVRSAESESFAIEPVVACQVEGCIGDSVSTATGRLWLEQDDVAADPVRGIVGIQRTYLRDGVRAASFGPGWRSLLDTKLEQGEARTLTGFPSLPAPPLELTDDELTFADGTRWRFDDGGLLAAVITRTGTEVALVRDATRVELVVDGTTVFDIRLRSGRVVQITDERPDGAGTYSYGYDDAGRLALVSADDDIVVRYAYNSGGGLKQVESSDRVTRVDWADGERVRSITVGGQTTRLQLPASGSGTALVTLPGASKASEYDHDSQGRLIEVRQGTSVPLQRKYDAQGRLVMERSASDRRTYSWTDGRLSRVTSSATGVTDLGWDDAGRLTSVQTNGMLTEYAFDDSTWAPTSVRRGGSVTTYRYRAGALVGATDADGVAVDLGTLRANGLIAPLAPIGKDQAPKCNAVNDGLRLDAACRPTGLDAGDASSKVAYDDYGRIRSTTGPAAKENFEYDERGRVAATTRGSITFQNRYDGDRLTSVMAGDAEFASYDYDAAGRITGVSSSNGTVRRTYDAAGRVERVEDGGLTWRVTKRTKAGRPLEIDTPYGTVSVRYGKDGQPSSTAVTAPGTSDRITTNYDREVAGTTERTRIERGGYVSTFDLNDGRIERARTPLGSWSYEYEKSGRLTRASGPNGLSTYRYDTDKTGAVRLRSATGGSEQRMFSWDELGRLSKLSTGGSEQEYRYGADGISVNDGEHAVVWDATGRPSEVTADGDTERWTWNTDGTLRSVNDGDKTWTARYDASKRLVGFDAPGGDDDVDITWATNKRGPATPRRLQQGDDRLALGWSDLGELTSAERGDDSWRISRDRFHNVTEVQRGGDGAGTLKAAWKDGLPVQLSSGGDDRLSFSECTDASCSVDLQADGTIASLAFDRNKIRAVSGDQTTTFALGKDGRASKGCQTIDGQEKCTAWPKDEDPQLDNVAELLGAGGQIPGVASSPLMVDPPALTTLPDELAPTGLRFELPDEELERSINSAIPTLPDLYRLGDNAPVRLAERLMPTETSIAAGPALQIGVTLVHDGAFGALPAPFGEDGPYGRLAAGIAGIGQSSLLGDITGAIWDLLPDLVGMALQFAASLLSGGIAGAVVLAVALGTCIAGSPSCGALAVTGALLLFPGIGPVVGIFLRDVLIAAVDGTSAALHGASWEQVELAAGTGVLLASLVRGAKPLARLCNAKRVWCLDAAKTPEAAANAVESRGRWGVLTVDRANATARRAEALSGKPARPGYDRDEFPPAATRQGGAGARVEYINPSDNRAAGAALGRAIRDLDDNQRFAYLVVDSRDGPLTALDTTGAWPALWSSWSKP